MDDRTKQQQHDAKIRYKNRMKLIHAYNRGDRQAQRQRYALTHKTQVRASILIKNAVHEGRLKKPRKCYLCEVVVPEGYEMFIVGHHPDYRSLLKVIWVCVMCHNEIHLCLKNWR